MIHMAPFVLGYVIDLIIGDPNWPYHPVRIIGYMVSAGEKPIRKFCKTMRTEYIGGAVLTLFVTSASFAVIWFILTIAARLNIYIKLIIETFFCYTILATKSLKTESMKVYHAFNSGGIDAARKYLSFIVGRDTGDLSEEQIIKAAVETISENTSDGIIAPMLFLTVGGAPFGFLYKAVNTLDSMIGYKNDKYLYFGRAAARLDDLANFLPSYISAYLMLLAAKIIGMDMKNGFKIYKRDKSNHSSPNSAKTEAVCAGSMNIQLGGDAYYFGKLVKKKSIGDDIRKVNIEDIRLANRLMYATSVLGLVFFVILRTCVLTLISTKLA